MVYMNINIFKGESEGGYRGRDLLSDHEHGA